MENSHQQNNSNTARLLSIIRSLPFHSLRRIRKLKNKKKIKRNGLKYTISESFQNPKECIQKEEKETNQPPFKQTLDKENQTIYSPINLTSSSVIQIQDEPLLKISFSPNELPADIQALFFKKEKLLNTALMLPSTKFFVLPPNEVSLENSYLKLCKWTSALIIYQARYKKVTHFGLLLKHKHRFISFDGIQDMCPSFAEQSYHWEAQKDEWSCGYRVLFWYNKIRQTGGIEEWISKYQPRIYE